MLFDVIASVALGIPGSYSFYGIPVNFIDKGTSSIDKLAIGVLGGNYINTFVHELGHSLAYKYICGSFGKISINSNAGGLCTIKRWRLIGTTNLQDSFVSLAGPLLQISFGLLTSLMVHKIHKRTSKYRGSFSYRILITTLKIQNVYTVIYPMFSPLDLFLKVYNISNHMSDNSDFMQIYQSSGPVGASLASALILSIGFLAFKVIFLQPEIKKEAPTFVERIYKIIENVTHWMPLPKTPKTECL